MGEDRVQLTFNRVQLTFNRVQLTFKETLVHFNVIRHSTVTDFARLRGLSTSQPLWRAA